VLEVDVGLRNAADEIASAFSLDDTQDRDDFLPIT
jgi:hypothetical protein